MEKNPIEYCVICGKKTNYRFNDHIDTRRGYVGGLGQLCSDCNQHTAEKEYITIPLSLIRDTPNDCELGERVRTVYGKLV